MYVAKVRDTMFQLIKTTFISPSAEPVTNSSSCGSKAIHFIALSCAYLKSFFNFSNFTNLIEAGRLTFE